MMVRWQLHNVHVVYGQLRFRSYFGRDQALLSMRRGERCSIQCTDERLREGATVAVPEGGVGRATAPLAAYR